MSDIAVGAIIILMLATTILLGIALGHTIRLRKDWSASMARRGPTNSDAGN